MALRLHFGPPEAADFEALVYQIPPTEFQNLTRSTIPLLCYWREGEPVLSRFVACIFRDSRCPSGDLCFEYPVKSLGHRQDRIAGSEDFELAAMGIRAIYLTPPTTRGENR